MTNNNTQQTDTPNQLENAQHAIRKAYFDDDCGLFVLQCVAGAGKSLTVIRVSAEDILRRYVDDDITPEQHIAVVSFNSDEAAEIVPDLCDQLRAIVEYDLRPVASEVSEEEVEHLIDRIQQSPFIGTIDSVLRGVLKQFVGDIGFTTMPSVGNEAKLARVRADCYDELKTDSTHRAKLNALEAAYPKEDSEEFGKYDSNTAEMLSEALTYCRNRQLSTAEFQEKLEQTRQAVYAEHPGEFDAVVAAVKRVVGDDSIGTTVRDQITGEDREELAEADETLYEVWGDRIGDFCDVFAAYRETYQEQTREHGAVSHTDVAFLVASYLEGTLAEYVAVEIDYQSRQRILQRFHGRLQSLIIDEAQDVSKIQHAALSQLVHPEMRVLAAGDLIQSIYTWRHADPQLFESATIDGEYLGIDWSPHVTERATTTYRCVPGIAGAINEITEPVFTSESRGNIGNLDTQAAFERLDAARNPQDETAVHISGFSGGSNPGSSQWVLPDDGTGEAEILAKHLSNGLADGTFTDSDGAQPAIRVLFRRGTRMSEYKQAFEAEGLSVRTASAHLFDAPEVRVVLSVCDWLVDPESSKRIKQLVNELPLDLASRDEKLLDEKPDEDGWDITAVIENNDLSAEETGVLRGLQKLRDRSDICAMQPAATYLEDIIECLALRADAYGLCQGNPSQQRVANLDALVESVGKWEDDEQYSPAELTELVAPFRNTPGRGPVQPSTAMSAYDVKFEKIHPAKGDEDDIVAIADPGFDAGNVGVHKTRLATHGPIAGLAPPTDVDIPTEIEIPPFVNGLYDPTGDSSRDIGLRWATARWGTSVTEGAQPDELVGPDQLQQVVQSERAELWRLLYVALTRARNHLVLPLPAKVYGDEFRDQWIETLKRGLEYDSGTDSYSLSTPSGAIDIGVNDADFFGPHATQQHDTTDTIVGTMPPQQVTLNQWIPRDLSPSTLHPITENPAEHALSHLLGKSIHTESNDTSDGLNLPFDEMGPDQIGSAIHDTLTGLIDREVSEAKLEAREDVVMCVFNDVVDESVPAISEDARQRLWDFFSNILGDFLRSDLWQNIQQAESVRVEQSVDGLIKTDGIGVTLSGQVDIVMDMPSDERVVTDIKIALAHPTDETQRRYNSQVLSYAYLYGRQKGAIQSVRPTIETFGFTRKTASLSGWPELIEHRIRQLSG